ncbi:MAG TPA: SusC/RagA family TonB-linked outer membrane protein [Gemmatimonadaceae bacterium]|nr:SusC/RagA family TonB-linked outer membrane protein [Gemmatimonadaceae bacterium]
MSFRFRRMTASLAATAAMLAVSVMPLAAQDAGTIQGKVVETGSLHPISDVQVFVEGTHLGAVTNAAGEYTISQVPAGAHTVRARLIGYTAVAKPATVAAGSPVVVDFQLSRAALQLDQIVVTGTAAPVAQRQLGNSVTTLDVSDLTSKSSMQNVSDLLQSKAPGVHLTPGSGVPGTAADIRIRGISSLSATNRPIFYIDGIRYNDASNGNYGPSGSGDGVFSQGTSALDALNPEDIESIQIIKGPAAATLYGADAAGGVIQIITKKGTRGEQKVRWDAHVEGGGTNWALPRLTNYTTCTAARIADTTNWPGCNGLAEGTVLTGNPLETDPQALRTGPYEKYSLSVGGGGPRYSFFAGADVINDRGVFFNSYNDRRSARANFSVGITDKIDLAVSSSFTKTHTRLPLGDDAASGIIISATRGQPGSAANDGSGWRIRTPDLSNQYDNQLDADRTILGATLNYRPTTWFRNRFTAGVDINDPLATIYYAPNSAFSIADGVFPSGFIAQRMPQTHLWTFDYAGIFSSTLPKDLSSEFSVGVQGTKNDARTVSANGNGLPAPDFQLVQSATTVSGATGLTQIASLGYYAQEQIGWKNRLFVTGALRADNNSAFGDNFQHVYYPKASLSYVASEEPALASIFDAIHADNFRLRFAYGEAGRAPGPYDALRTYGTIRVANGDGSVSSGLTAGSPGNPDLHAERGREFEGGFDASFLGNRAGLEFTAYHKTTNDALVSIGSPASTGFTAGYYINFAQLQNTGIELTLRGTPVQTHAVTWDAQFALSTNHNKLNKLNLAGTTQLIPYNPYAPTAYPTQLIKEGYPVAGFWGEDVLRNPDGSYALDANGKLQYDSTLKYVGPSDPTYEGSLSNTVTLFGNIRLYALIDFKGGNYLFDQKDRNRDQASNRNSLHFNDPAHPLSAADSAYYSGNATMPWIVPADFIKLRDVSVSYTFPQSLTSRLGGKDVTLTLSGHNLGFISKKYPGIDPEVNFFGSGTFRTGTTNFIQFIRVDSYTLPMLRRFTASLNVSF